MLLLWARNPTLLTFSSTLRTSDFPFLPHIAMSLLFTCGVLGLITSPPRIMKTATAGRGSPLHMVERSTAAASATLPDTPPAVAFRILATPSNWADLFLFAASVEACDGADSNAPLVKGTRIRELAGVPPIVNELFWVTTVADPSRGVLELESAGSSSVLEKLGARDARLAVSVTSDGASGSRVEVSASYVGDGPLAAAVAPALSFELGVSARLLFPSRLTMESSSPKASLTSLEIGWSIAVWAAVFYVFFVLTADDALPCWYSVGDTACDPLNF